MNYAVWHIFDPNAPLVGDAQFWLTEAMLQAQTHFPGSDFDKVYIITPVNQHDPDPMASRNFWHLARIAGFVASISRVQPLPSRVRCCCWAAECLRWLAASS